jgi:hypothetical protein
MPLVHEFSHTELVCTLPPHLFIIHFNIIFPHTSRSFKWSFAISFSDQNCNHFSYSFLPFLNIHFSHFSYTFLLFLKHISPISHTHFFYFSYTFLLFLIHISPISHTHFSYFSYTFLPFLIHISPISHTHFILLHLIKT